MSINFPTFDRFERVTFGADGVIILSCPGSLNQPLMGALAVKMKGVLSTAASTMSGPPLYTGTSKESVLIEKPVDDVRAGKSS